MSFTLIIETNPSDAFVTVNGKAGKVFRLEPGSKNRVVATKLGYDIYHYEITMPFCDTKVPVELRKNGLL